MPELAWLHARDYDAGGDLVSLEILDASRRTTDPRSVQYEEAS